MHHNDLKLFIENKNNYHPRYKYNLGGMNVDRESVEKSIDTHHWTGDLRFLCLKISLFKCDCGAKCFSTVNEYYTKYFDTPIITLNFECNDFECTLNWDVKDIIE